MRIAIWSFCLLQVGLGATHGAAPVEEREFLWQQANTRMADAKRPEEFLLAAQIYQKLVSHGVRNGPLYYNLGTALLMAGRADQAVRALERAERYSGGRIDIRQNLRIAAESAAQRTHAPSNWRRLLFFWHFRLPTGIRMTVTVWVYGLVWMGACLHRLGLRRISRSVLTITLVLLAVFVSSVVASLHAEASDRAAETLSYTRISDNS